MFLVLYPIKFKYNLGIKFLDSIFEHILTLIYKDDMLNF